MGLLAVMHPNPELIPFCNAVRLLVTRNGNYHFPYYDLFTEVDRLYLFHVRRKKFLSV